MFDDVCAVDEVLLVPLELRVQNLPVVLIDFGAPT